MEGAGFIHVRRVGRNAGAQNTQVLAAEGGMPMAAGLHVHACIEQGRDVLSQRLSTAQIRNRDLRTTPSEEESRGKTRHSQPDDENLPAFELHERELKANWMCAALPFFQKTHSLANRRIQ